jgi:hypothetical protein
MEVPRDLLIPILQCKIGAIFKLYTGKREHGSERIITVGRKTYAVADITSTNVVTIDKLSEDDIKLGGFKDFLEFETWWFQSGYREHNPIYVIRFNILKLKPLGKWYMKKMNLHLPIIKEELGDYDE